MTAEFGYPTSTPSHPCLPCRPKADRGARETTGLRRIARHLIAAACSVLLIAIAGTDASADVGIAPATAPDDAARMALAAEQLARTQLPSGLFPYDYDFATGAAENMDDPTGPNIVRQTDASFALSEYLVTVDGQSPRKTIAGALRAFEARSLPIGKGIVQTALEHVGVYNRWRYWMSWRKPLNSLGLLYSPRGDGAVVSANRSYERAWTGATALALIVELKYRAVTGDERFAKTRARWLRGLLALHVPGRGFREAPHYLTESAYVNGESWLALAEYARAFPGDRQVSRLLPALDDYFVARYGPTPLQMFYHWGTMAAAVRAETTHDPRFVKFIRRQTAWMISTQKALLEGPGNSCASIEGLATAYGVLRRYGDAADPLLGTLRQRITVMMRHNRALQLLPGMSRIRLADGSSVSSPRLKDFAGAFLLATTSSKTQIDMTGHCLSALIRMQQAGLTPPQ